MEHTCCVVLNHVQLFVTLLTKSPPGSSVHAWVFPGKNNWSGLPFPSPGDPPDPGMEPMSPALAGEFFTSVQPTDTQIINNFE